MAWQWHHPWACVHARGVPTLKWSIRFVYIMPGGFPEKECEVWAHSSYFIHLVSKYWVAGCSGAQRENQDRETGLQGWGIRKALDERIMCQEPAKGQEPPERKGSPGRGSDQPRSSREGARKGFKPATVTVPTVGLGVHRGTALLQQGCGLNVLGGWRRGGVDEEGEERSFW